MTIPVEDWKWQGSPAHPKFLMHGFRLRTVIGAYIVSTAGNFHTPPEHGRLASHDDFDSGTFETMVFRSKPCDCGCGVARALVGDDLAVEDYADRCAANAGHMRMCRKVADWDQQNPPTEEDQP